MNFQQFFVGVVAFLCYCHETSQMESISGTKGSKGTKPRIMKAFLMQCDEHFNSHNNIQVTFQIAEHRSSETVNSINFFFCFSFALSLILRFFQID